MPTIIASSIARLQLGRDAEVLLDDVVHRLVAQHERRAEIELRHAHDVALVLDVPRLVEAEIAIEVREHRRRDGALALAERAALDRAHHPERHEDDEEDDRIVQMIRRTTNFSMPFLSRGTLNPAGGWAPPAGLMRGASRCSPS
jgi:hypothetical protein